MEKMTLSAKKVFLQTFGCQMNERDSEGVKGVLLDKGYDFTDQMESAQVILLNTCSVRQHAEDRVFGRFGKLTKIKQKSPDTIVGILGCMAQEHGSKFFKKMPALDLVCGPGNIHQIPELLDRLYENKTQITAIDRINDMEYNMDNVGYRAHKVRASVNIMSGCDHKCTYCIVPKTRGIERSRPAKAIADEISSLIDRGYKDILLLGQNVNCYGKKLDEDIDFTQLLHLIDQEVKPERIRFTTSHPKDAHIRLFEAMRDLDSVCEHLHLPVQSGSNKVLRRMKREHTREWYLDRIREFKKIVPNGSITTDIIVGFCGETDEDFLLTKSLMEEVEFDSAYMFKYSERPDTPASRLEDDIPEAIKSDRLQQLLEMQRSIVFKKNTALIGTEMEVLFDDHDLSVSNKAFGRTRTFKRVVVNHSDLLLGKIASVHIDQVLNETLLGTVKSVREA